MQQKGGRPDQCESILCLGSPLQSTAQVTCIPQTNLTLSINDTNISVIKENSVNTTDVNVQASHNGTESNQTKRTQKKASAGRHKPDSQFELQIQSRISHTTYHWFGGWLSFTTKLRWQSSTILFQVPPGFARTARQGRFRCCGWRCHFSPGAVPNV